MKYCLVLLLILMLFGCRNSKPIYEECIKNCLHPQIGNEDYYPNPECILGAQIPEFEAISLEGVKINRETLLGKPSVLNFWFTTCAPCVAEIPGFNSIVDKFGPDQVNFIAFGRDSKEDVKEFLRETPWKFLQVADAQGIMTEKFRLPWGFPTTFVLNRHAEIVQVFCGGQTDSTAIVEIQKKLIPIIEMALK